MFQDPLTLVLTGLYQTLWHSDRTTKEQDPYDSLDTMPSDSTPPDPPALTFTSLTPLRLILIVTEFFTLPFAAFFIISGLQLANAVGLVMIFGFVACSLRFGMFKFEWLREENEIKTEGMVTVDKKKGRSGTEGQVEGLDEMMEKLDKSLEDEVMKSSGLVPSKACVEALVQNIDTRCKTLEGRVEVMEKRLVKHIQNEADSCEEAFGNGVDDLQEMLKGHIVVSNDMLRRRLQNKVSGMERRMRLWSQEKIDELEAKIGASLKAKLVNQGEERSRKATSAMPKQLTVLTEQLELPLEGEWKGIGKARAMARLQEAIEKIMLLVETGTAEVLASDSNIDFEEGLELAVGRRALGGDHQDTLNEAFIRSQESHQEADTDDEESSEDDWKLIDQI